MVASAVTTGAITAATSLAVENPHIPKQQRNENRR